MNNLQMEACRLSKNFLENEKQYRLGFIEAEQSNTITRTLGESYVADTYKGIEMLIDVDETLIDKYVSVLNKAEFDRLVDSVSDALDKGGRIIISGCGSTGRLAMRIEASWRIAASQAECSKVYSEKVISLMTGGDFALIRAVESFEDYIQLGRMQARELKLGANDILIGVTATGETTSILGTAVQALEDGASVWMVVCTNPSTLLGKLKRADDVYCHANCQSLYIPCGGMAVTGSTRMQSTSIEQAIVGSALEIALKRIKGETIEKDYLINAFRSCIALLRQKKTLDMLASQTKLETDLYQKNGHVTYYADEYLLDVLADTTERGPTFGLPPFRPQKNTGEPLSWAFVKNPHYTTEQAWTICFQRKPRCIDKTNEEYALLGLQKKDILRIPRINVDALLEYEIGCEADPERESGKNLATWIGAGKIAPDVFWEQTRKYSNASCIMLDEKAIYKTELGIFEHLAMKMMINIVSTGTMAKMGKIFGNYMVNLKISNKKLVDRASRIVSALCGISYEKANYEIFYTQLILEKEGRKDSETKETILRLKNTKLESK